MGLNLFSYYGLVSYRKSQLQFLYQPPLSGIKFLSRVLCSCWLFLYPCIVTLPNLLRLLLFQCISHCMMFILYLPISVTFRIPYSYANMHLDKVFLCRTWIGLLKLFISSILYLFCLVLLLFNKYRQCVNKFRNTNFIYHYLCQTLIIVTKSTILQRFLLISHNMPLQIFSDFCDTTHWVDL